RTLTNEAGRVTDRYSYDAYGNLLEKEGDTKNEFLYTGEQYNANTGLYYLRARYMNPSTGTFISMDSYQGSIYDPVTLHKYLYANANPVMYTDPSGYYSLAECSIAQTINGILNESRMLNVLRGLNFAKKATVVCNTFNIGVQVKNIICADSIGEVIDSFISIALSCVTIVTTVKDVGFVVSMFASAIGIGNDIRGIVSAVMQRNWSDVVYNLGFLCIDVISMGMGIDDHNFEKILKDCKFVRSSNQETLISLTKETVLADGLTEAGKDILFDWSKEYDSFEDVWNLIYHLKVK
ncbi:MAG: RHS repeat-associated core domain-containing protein, partial [Lachnospiraceae bacterium]|nr:RHS repeat-associated core domain-containing protein [Lachnospiraceae bacterium]